MRFRVRVVDKETGEVLYEEVCLASSAEQAKRIARCHIEAWKLEEHKGKINIITEKLRESE